MYYDGRYELPIPFKHEAHLPQNDDIAKERLKRLLTRLTRDSALFVQYAKYMNDLVDKGYAELVRSLDENSTERVWYLPHHPVFNYKKPGKIRVVFDCSAK